MDCNAVNHSNISGEQMFSQEFNRIFNNYQEVNLNNEVIYKYSPFINKLDNIPPEKLVPPPLVKRLNIELEQKKNK